MKMRHLTLIGLLIITLGCFLPFESGFDTDGTVNLLSFFPISGIVFLVISKDGSFGNGRIVGGIFGLLMGLFTVSLIIDMLSYPLGTGIRLAYEGPTVIIIGVLLTCITGFSDFTGSRHFHIWTVLLLACIGIIGISFLLPSPCTCTLQAPYKDLSEIILAISYISMPGIYIGSIFIIKESRKIN